ncbi:type III pantothenate kinase [Marinicella sp. S1101]|uniref:type III pantothenate kinase n=1 Tax=Marinicella marina TaxID=2996016 RepID=UPI002260CE93|nr:type III pantothenate kinase [Marinicella marina]MCX7552692.1 type III pantothenate kinase [Marinicella marina]MDJ1139568.1 type III pantothenate kinase [Marinicella marina]
MILCLDIGNSHMHGGVFDGDELKVQFRMASKTGASSDEYGVFLRSVLRENGINHEQIEAISLCSVVPEVLYPINACCQKYFDIEPFVLQAGVKTGLQIGYRNPLEVGADRIANAIAITHLFPNQDAIVIDLGTATTFCAISAARKYLGGVIMPGMKMSMKALESGASKLGSVEIVEREEVLGRTTNESIQSGLFYGARGAIKEIIQGLKQQSFKGNQPHIIGTGGFTSVFRSAGIFNEIIPDLVLKGLYLAYKINQEKN